jgi:hypothetical protein
MIDALAGKEVICVAAGDAPTASWTEAGELFAFGCGADGCWATEG